MFQRFKNNLISPIIGKVLGMVGRASRLDLDEGQVPEMAFPPPAPPIREKAGGQPHLRLIEGGRATTPGVTRTPIRPQPSRRQIG